MKILPAVVLFLICFFSFQISYSQDSAVHITPDPNSFMQDTTISLDRSFIVRNVYARKDKFDAIRDSIRVLQIWNSQMHDTVVILDPSFVMLEPYAEIDSIDNIAGAMTDKRNAIRDSLNAIGGALLHTADMQDTLIFLDPAFIVGNRYAKIDVLNQIRDSVRSSLKLASQMQDTTILLDPSFIVGNLYLAKDREEASRDSLTKDIARLSAMQDTTILLDPTFIVGSTYVTKDRLDAIRDSIERSAMMQDTVIALDPAYIVKDLYPVKDSLDAISISLKAIRDSLTAISDSLRADSISRHWAGWKNIEIKPDHTFNLNSKTVLKGKSKSELQYNIADFYLFLNGEPVLPTTTPYNFFAAACLGFKYDDTLLLNSGLGAKVGVGVGIKVIQGKFTSTLHANTHNTPVYKFSQDDSVYFTSVVAEPLTQSLILKYFPDGSRNEVIIGEYQATYKKFYQKTDDDQDEVRRYTVRIIFRCRVNGRISSL